MALTRMRARLTVVRWLLVVIALAITAHADTVVVDEGFEELNLGKHLDLAYDPSGDATIDDVLAGKLQFAPSTKDVPNFGYRGGSEWAHLRIRDGRALADSLVLEHGYAITDTLELFEVEGGRVLRHGRTGDHVLLGEWDMLWRFPAFKLAARADHDLYLRLESEASHQLPFTLYARDPDGNRFGVSSFPAALFER